MNVSKITPMQKRNGGLRVKTFVFGFTHAEELDETVNAFCSAHRIVSITAIKHVSKIGYAVVYVEYTKEQET